MTGFADNPYATFRKYLPVCIVAVQGVIYHSRPCSPITKWCSGADLMRAAMFDHLKARTCLPIRSGCRAANFSSWPEFTGIQDARRAFIACCCYFPAAPPSLSLNHGIRPRVKVLSPILARSRHRRPSSPPPAPSRCPRRSAPRVRTPNKLPRGAAFGVLPSMRLRADFGSPARRSSATCSRHRCLPRKING